MKLFGLVLVGLTNAEADFQVVSCNNEHTKAPEMTIKVRDPQNVISHAINFSYSLKDGPSIPYQS